MNYFFENFSGQPIELEIGEIIVMTFIMVSSCKILHKYVKHANEHILFLYIFKWSNKHLSVFFNWELIPVANLFIIASRLLKYCTCI